MQENVFEVIAVCVLIFPWISAEDVRRQWSFLLPQKLVPLLSGDWFIALGKLASFAQHYRLSHSPRAQPKRQAILLPLWLCKGLLLVWGNGINFLQSRESTMRCSLYKIHCIAANPHQYLEQLITQMVTPVNRQIPQCAMSLIPQYTIQNRNVRIFLQFCSSVEAVAIYDITITS